MTNVEDYLQAMDVFVFPSRFEGLGIAALEAQCAGLPVVLSDHVPGEVRVSDNVVFLPLEDGASRWAEAVRSLPGSQRKDQSRAVRDAGFDIRMTASVIRRLYLERKQS